MRPLQVLPPSVGWDPKDMMRLSCVGVPIAGTCSEWLPPSVHAQRDVLTQRDTT